MKAPANSAPTDTGSGAKLPFLHLHLGVYAREHVAHEDEHGRRRDDLAQCPGGADYAGGELRVVAGAHHGRQGDQPHGDHRCADDAGRGREHGADEHYGDAEAAAQVAEELAHRQQQLLGDAGAFEHHAHEDEQRHRHQHLVGHGADVAVGERAEVRWIEDAQAHAQGAEDERRAGEAEGDGEAEHQRTDDGEEHHAGQDLSEQDCSHDAGSSRR
jgi:hypothetical protein